MPTVSIVREEIPYEFSVGYEDESTDGRQKQTVDGIMNELEDLCSDEEEEYELSQKSRGGFARVIRGVQ